MMKRLFAIALGFTAYTPAAGAPAMEALVPVPTDAATKRYCMRVEAATGSRIEAVRCWTRSQWEAQGVDLDRDWPVEGVRTIG